MKPSWSLYLLHLVASIGLMAIVSGCVLHPDQEEIIGIYIAEYGFGTDSLTLKPDGSYTQEIKVKGRPELLRASGTWKYDQTKSRINFSDLYLIPNPYTDEWDEKTSTNRGWASLPVARYFFTRKLRFGPDEGHPFNKI